jgi:thiol:disulfide interchange protein DsbD
VFEAGLSAQRAAGSISTGGGLFGAFGTGVLAVLVAAPCTAPFMAAAIGYALTASAPFALAVFAALGLGLALPFTLLSFSPGLLARFPRPGAWMEGLRHVLAFPMYGAAAWLAWVFIQLTNVNALGYLFAAALALGFALYLFGGAQRRQAEGEAGVFGLLGAGLFVAGAVFLAAMAPTAPAGEEGAEAYSSDKLAELRAEGRPVFVNFTAAWCVTCKVNEATTLSQPAVKAAMARTHTVYLVGDWTHRDAVIARTLADHGRAGVPLYLVYRPGAAEPKVLPQVLTTGIVVDALEK